MSSRSKREHKPTTKYLNYYSGVSSPPNNGNKHSKTPEQENRSNISPPIRSSNPISSMIKRPTKICGSRRLTTDKVEVLCEDDCISSPESMSKKSSSTEGASPEIRRSGRKHKPNLKLQEYIQPSNCKFGSQSSESLSTPKNRNEKNSDRGDVSSSDSCPSTSPKRNKEKNEVKDKNNSPVDYYFDGFDVHDEPNTRKLSIGLVDCFEGLTKELAKTYPVTSVESDSPVYNQYNESLKQKSRPEKLKNECHNTNNGIKRPSSETWRDFSKQKRFKPSTVRNLTKTKKSTRVTTVVETLDLRNNKRRRMVTKNKELKVTKHYPVKKSIHAPTSSTVKEDTSSPPATSSNQNIGTRNPLKNSALTQKYFKKQEVDNQANNIKETLKKFLIMGTKVANAISETLKHNEEALLSKSSAFEKKCLSLVHALAQQGSDLEEEDMEKVLKLLDEEQEERRAYRHTFLESLRVSHLTNMALYSQMLRLLKTL